MHDLNTDAATPVEPLDPDRLSLLRGVVNSRPLEERLEGEALALYDNFAYGIERGAVELERAIEGARWTLTSLTVMCGFDGTERFASLSCRTWFGSGLAASVGGSRDSPASFM